MFVEAQHFKPDGVGIGDEVFSVSLFGFRGKKYTNAPIARMGNLAMLPMEKIPSGPIYGDMEAYLVEARSIGGISGAPIFVRETTLMRVPGKDNEGNDTTLQLQTQGSFGLLGLVHGHWDIKNDDLNEVLPRPDSKEGVNMGIAIVVPASKILDLLRSDEMRIPRIESVNRKKRKLQEEAAVTLDSALDEPQETQDAKLAMRRFEGLASRLFKAEKKPTTDPVEE